MIRFLQSGNKAAKYILGGFLVILAVSMVAYLIPGFMTPTDASGRTGIVAKVGGADIRSDEVAKLVSAQLARQHYPETLAPFYVPQALQQLIQQQEIRYEAERLGLTVSNREVQDELRNGKLTDERGNVIGYYKDIFFPDGKWIGQEKYAQLVTENGSNGRTVADFERGVRDQLLQRKLFSAISGGVTVSPAELEQAYKDQNLKVKLQYAVLTLAGVQKEIKPTDADLKAFYQASQAYQNSIPEKRQLRYFVLQDADAEGKMIVSPAELQRYYSSHPDDYRLPERVRVRHILISIPAAAPGSAPDQKAIDAARAKAADILKQVKAGGDFSELAKKNSQDPGSTDKGGELGWIVKGQTVAEFEKAAFAQAPGQISDLVQTSFGFHIIQTEEKEQARVKPLAEVKDQIEKFLKAQKAGDYLDKKANAAVDMAQKQGLEKAAALNGAPVIDSNPVGRGDELPGVGAAPGLMGDVFAAAEKSVPQLERTSHGYVIFQIAKIIPARTPSFEEIRDRVTADFKSQRARDLLQKKTQELADRAHAGHDLAKAAKEAGATVKTSDLVGRTSQVPEIGPMSSRAAAVAFTLKPGEISGPLSLGQSGVVLQVMDRQEPSVSDPQFAQQRDALLEQLSEQKRRQALELFISNLDSRLEKEGKRKIYKAELDTLSRPRT